MSVRLDCGCAMCVYLLARSDVNIVNTTKDSGGDLRAERIPHTVLKLDGVSVRTGRALDLNSLLAVNVLARSAVKGDQSILFAAGDENTLVTMGLDDHLSTTLHATASTTAIVSRKEIVQLTCTA